MNTRSFASFIASLAACGAGWSSAPEAPAAATMAASASVPAKTTVPSVAAPAAPAITDTNAIRKTAKGLGLSPRNQKGVEVYCRKSAEIGTRLETINCYTSEQVQELEKRKQSNQDDVDALRRASMTEPNRH